MNQCYGWTCPSCSHHWISCFRIGSMTCKCGHKKWDYDYDGKLRRARLSQPISNLPVVDASREAVAP